MRKIGQTRTWLATTDREQPAWTFTRGYWELQERRTELDTILATAPADQRHTISQLQNGQLSLDDTARLLDGAVAGQSDRQAWIIEHWPHIVEYQEIQHTLDTQTWGPDPRLLTNLRHTNISNALSTAIDNNEPWLRVVLCMIASAQPQDLDETHVRLLEAAATGVPDWMSIGAVSGIDATHDLPPLHHVEM